jgi:hypothetical protein
MLKMAGGADSIDLKSLWAVLADCGANILADARDVRRTAWVPTRSWWRSSGYKSALATIDVKLREVMCYACHF